ncbi:hypothetical protein K491DRAFT_756185 [Lophiostoma macrostomum CBS 122681]|uniref:Probable double zinc ribbon domain-containing protein n=1 Tax=Lophiostoma macrostomum CBS 122681 TaxID=1314788 RepID=A0A6A6THZ7_9PLEO|nr:hypothetical protein K491DRAFT_756185 [Lophiostoma macrostomum CBS 122681]
MRLLSMLKYFRSDREEKTSFELATSKTKDVEKLRKDLAQAQQLKIGNFNRLIRLHRPVQGHSGPTYYAVPVNLDGEWTCCSCDKINPLVKIDGPHPLGYATCSDCAHIWCRKCSHTDVIQFIPKGARLSILRELSRNLKEQEDVPEGTICEGCGLTWRATSADEVMFYFPKLKCFCGLKFPATSMMAYTMPWDDKSSTIIKKGIDKYFDDEYSGAECRMKKGQQEMNEIQDIRSRNVSPCGGSSDE